MSSHNLLNETIQKLADHGFKPAHVRWVGSRAGNVATDWATFAKLADEDYDYSYGSVEVAPDLVVVGDDWWLERAEYDGSEWWEFKKLPQRREGFSWPDGAKVISTEWPNELEEKP